METNFWRKPRAKALTPIGKLVYIYLVSSPHGNSIGLYHFDRDYIAIDTGLDPEQAMTAFKELIQAKLVRYDEALALLLITGWWGHNKVENPNVARNVVVRYAEMPPCDLKHESIVTLHKYLDCTDTVRKALETLWQTLPKRFGKAIEIQNQNQNLNQNPEPEPEPDNSTNAYTPEFETAFGYYPKRSGGNPKKGAFRAWSARVKAGVDPKVMTEGVRRYAAFNEATEKIDTPYVMQAQTFFGPEDPPHFLEPWKPPPKKRSGSRAGVFAEEAGKTRR